MAFDAPLFDPGATGVFADRFAAPDVTPARPTMFALGGVPIVRLTLQGIYGTLTIGPSTVPIRLSPPVDGMATIDVGPGNLTLDAISSIAGQGRTSAAAVDPRAILPASLVAAIGGAVVSHVRVRVDLTARRLTAVGVDVVGDRSWPLLPGRLAVTDLNLSVNVHSRGAVVHVSGALTGIITLGGTPVPVVASPLVGQAVPGYTGLDAHASTADPVGPVVTGAVPSPAPIAADGRWWSVLLDSVDGIPLGSLRDLAGLLDDDGIDGLAWLAQTGTNAAAVPVSPARDRAVGPAATQPPMLTDLAIRVAPSGAVDSVAISLDIGSNAESQGSPDSSTRRTAVLVSGGAGQYLRLRDD